MIDTQLVIAQYKAGKTLVQLAAIHGMSATYIHGVLRMNGISRKHRDKPVPVVDYDLDSMAKAYREGKTYAEVAQMHNMSAWKVRKVLQSNNIVVRVPLASRSERAARTQAMIESYRSGNTLNEIAETYEVTRQRVQQLFKKHDIARDVRGCRVCGATVEQQERAHGAISMPATMTPLAGDLNSRQLHIISLYKSGYTALDIGKLYGVTRQRVLQILVKHRVTRNDRGCPVCANDPRPRSAHQA